ncbi:MAG TPA: zf-HC2 domain-containing protein, partial [Frankiaceae bacterium]|nr:zf-HC2 domain-containing protein [Frankiaceae bacterium]
MIGSTVPERDEHPLDDLPALLSGELPPARDAQVGEHLAGCDTCRRELAVVARMSSWLQDAARLPFAEPVELPPLRIPRAQRRTRSRRWAGRPRLLAAAAAAAAVLAGGAAGLVALLDRGGGEQVTATVALRPLAPVTASGTATMEGHGAGQRMVVDVHGLPAPP